MENENVFLKIEPKVFTTLKSSEISTEQYLPKPETIFISSTCLFGSNKQAVFNFKNKEYKVTSPYDAKILKLALIKQKKEIENKEQIISTIEEKFKKFGLEEKEIKGMINEKKTEKTNLMEKLKKEETIYKKSPEFNKLTEDIGILTDKVVNLPKTQEELNILREQMLELKLEKQILSQYEYGLQLKRIVKLKELGATTINTNINTRQYYLYLKEFYNDGFLSAGDLTKWMNYVDVRCEFLEKSDKVTANSLGMEYQTIYAMKLREDKEEDKKLFREFMLNKEKTPKDLVDLLVDETSVNPYKEFYKFKAGESFKSFQDINHRSWVAKDVVKGYPATCVLEKEEEKQVQELNKLLEEIKKSKPEIEADYVVRAELVDIFIGNKRKEYEDSQKQKEEEYSKAIKENILSKKKVQKKDFEVIDLYREEQLLTQTIKDEIATKVVAEVAKLQKCEKEFTTFLKGGVEKGGSYLNIMQICGIELESEGILIPSTTLSQK